MEIKLGGYMVNLSVRFKEDSEASDEALCRFLESLSSVALGAAMHDEDRGNMSLANEERKLAKKLSEAAWSAYPEEQEDNDTSKAAHSVPYASDCMTIGVSPSEF